MKYNIYENGGDVQGAITIDGLIMTGKLRNERSPELVNELANKDYVDRTYANLAANLIQTGVLTVDRFGNLIGDFVSTPGSGIIRLSNSGVVPGTYTVATLKEGGLVTEGGSLKDTDIPALDWSKFTVNRPTTLAGYGITNAVDSTNAVVNGNIVVPNPVNANDLATKGYSETNLEGKVGSAPGDILRFVGDTVPSGFYQVNGGELDKTTDADIYAVIGDKYTNFADTNDGKPWEGIYEPGVTRTVGTFTRDADMLYPVTLTQVAVTKNRVYIVGSYVAANNQSSQIWAADIRTDGTIGSWETAGLAPYAAYWTNVVIYKNYIFMTGGTVNGTAAVYNVIYKAPILPDGTIGTWVSAGGFPLNSYMHRLIFRNGKAIFVSGGSYIYTAPVSDEGVIGTFVLNNNPPDSAAFSNTVVTDKFIYRIGGSISANSVRTVWRASFDENGVVGPWVSDTNLIPVANYNITISIIGRHVYMFGGAVGNYYTPGNNQYRAPINTDGTIGTWETLPTLPMTFSQAQCFRTSSRIYIIGLFDGYYGRSEVWSAPVEGGFNDYTPIFNEVTRKASGANKFRLPDFGSDETGKARYIIKR